MSRKRNIWKGLAAGAAGGLVASYIMSELNRLMSKMGQQSPEEQREKPATVKAAEAISESVAGRELSPDVEDTAGQAVHYAMGTASGALFGAVAEVLPLTAAGAGTVFGTALWAAADEVAVPALSLSKPPQAYPADKHARWLGAHLVYGAVTDIIRRLIRRYW